MTSAAPAVDGTPADTINTLLNGLKRERDPDKAREIAGQIRLEWADSHSATVNLLMQWAETAIREKRNPAAFDLLDQVTILDPNYAEGWNRRATLHYGLGEPKKAMSDIDRVLTLEPRHFGALAGMASIFAESGHDALALEAWQRYLDIYPADRDAQQQVNTLSEKLAGSRT